MIKVNRSSNPLNIEALKHHSLTKPAVDSEVAAKAKREIQYTAKNPDNTIIYTGLSSSDSLNKTYVDAGGCIIKTKDVSIAASCCMAKGADIPSTKEFFYSVLAGRGYTITQLTL